MNSHNTVKATGNINYSKLCRQKKLLKRRNARPHNIHMLVRIPPNKNVPSFEENLKRKRTMIIFGR